MMLTFTGTRNNQYVVPTAAVWPDYILFAFVHCISASMIIMMMVMMMMMMMMMMMIFIFFIFFIALTSNTITEQGALY